MAVYLFLWVIAGLFLWKVLKTVHCIFSEYYVLWNIAFGGNRSLNPAKRLHVYVCKTKLLDEVAVKELYDFLSTMINCNPTAKEFHNLVLGYKFLVSCREKKDGSLRGVMLMGVHKKEHNGIRYTNICLGLTFFQKFYRGSPLIHYVAAYHIMKELILHPFTPLYIIGKSFSYKSYLVLRHNFLENYPCYDRETPEFERGIMTDFATSLKLPNEVYNEESGVLERELSSMKEFVAPVSDTDMKADSDIKFFVEKNPNWAKGHQLVVLGKIRWLDIIKAVWKNLKKSIWSKSERVGSYKKKPTDDRKVRFFFQSESPQSEEEVHVGETGSTDSGHMHRKDHPGSDGGAHRRKNPQ